MTLARLALLIATYVSLDVSNPMMPGVFGAEESIEVRQSDRFRGQDHAVLLPRAPELERLDRPHRSVALSRLPAPVTPRSRQARVTRSHTSLPAPASPSEDS
jgi:hypothetical protein